MPNANRRNSKYITALQSMLTRLSHATNAQLADELRRVWPDVSDTTVHRITQRLVVAGDARYAPHAKDGAMVFDANTAEHDHFRCSGCDALRDITITDATRRELQRTVSDCLITGSLVIVGECCKCKNKEK